MVAQGQFRVLKVPLGFIKILQWVSYQNFSKLSSKYSHLWILKHFNKSNCSRSPVLPPPPPPPHPVLCHLCLLHLRQLFWDVPDVGGV